MPSKRSSRRQEKPLDEVKHDRAVFLAREVEADRRHLEKIRDEIKAIERKLVAPPEKAERNNISMPLVAILPDR